MVSSTVGNATRLARSGSNNIVRAGTNLAALDGGLFSLLQLPHDKSDRRSGISGFTAYRSQSF